ncbi:MAG: helix-turn-helix transcriptional regulator [Lachnospiraceae bacterium]|nr:helix-turn-helix transcriptional regulator [bacterium]MDY5517250.1 helix-turn-helix transcriptional regulator [Lachnospiraceae bacterium]
MSLGTNISYLRKQKKLTQEQFAEIMSVTRQTVSRWEADEVIPELAKLVEMCYSREFRMLIKGLWNTFRRTTLKRNNRIM